MIDRSKSIQPGRAGPFESLTEQEQRLLKIIREAKDPATLYLAAMNTIADIINEGRAASL